MKRPRVYLAGPDVFRPDAAHHFAMLAAICDTLGMKALAPFDESAAASTSARAIYASNMKLLRHADGLIANLAPFRGTEPDSGTVFEVGVAVALRLPVVAYGVPPGAYADRVRALLAVQQDDTDTPRDPGGLAVEDFGLPLNLMLACSVTLAGSAEEALIALRARLQPAP